MSHHLTTALALLEKYKTECDWAEQQREAAVTHALTTGDQIRTLQNKLHAKEQKETQIRRTVNTLARLMTSTEVNDAVHVQQAEKDEQERIRLEKQAQKQAQEAK
jgi:transcription initiation factor IIF auxiliary subunit